MKEFLYWNTDTKTYIKSTISLGESIRNSLNDLVKVSKNYKFKVHIRDDELIVRRIDKKEGWDFDMYLRVLNKPLHGDYEG